MESIVESIVESINTDLVNGCQQSDDGLKCDNDLQTKLVESEDKLNKFKALAIKLKKELKDTKEQLSKALIECNELKTDHKNAEKEQKSVSYQQMVRNFQSLQSEYDRLQDQSDSLTAKNKELDKSLTENNNELSKLRQELNDSKEEIEVLKTNIDCFKEDKQYLETKKREFESKVIILQNELDFEHKKNVSNTGLEQTIAELRHHLSAKTNEIVDLSDRLERANEQLKSFDQTLDEKQELISRIQNLEKENFNFKDDINKYNETLETQMSEIEDYKIRCTEASARIHSLETQLKSSNETFSSKVRSLESKISELQTYISEVEVELKKKDIKYEEYRNKVTKVLKQNGSQNNERNSKKFEALETTIDTLNSELNSLNEKLKMTLNEKESLENSFDELNSSHNSLKNKLNECNQSMSAMRERINEYKTENDKLKALSRELQSSLVNDHKQTEALHKAQLQQMSDKHKLEIMSLREDLHKSNEELKELRLELKTVGNSDQMSECLNKSHQSNNNSDDLESVETISISEKKQSISPTSMSGNLLKEILFSTQTQEIKPTQDFTKHLTIAQNKVENLTQLLEESENSNNLMSEQNRVLKEEIRRLQRSIERIEVAENLEYLKNIIVKFISFNSDDERQRLVPVLATVLKLSPEEQNLFKEFASIDQNSGNSSKWKGYLYQWSATNK